MLRLLVRHLRGQFHGGDDALFECEAGTPRLETIDEVLGEALVCVWLESMRGLHQPVS